MDNDPVICVWVHHPNDIHRNRIYSTYLTEMYLEEDPFVGVNGNGVVFAQTPCWSVLAMPVPTILEEKI